MGQKEVSSFGGVHYQLDKESENTMDMLLAGWYQYYQDAGLIRIVTASFLFLIVGIGSVMEGPLIVEPEERRLLTGLQKFSWCLVEATCEAVGKMMCIMVLFGMGVVSLEVRLPFSDFIGLTEYAPPLFFGTFIGRWGIFENPYTKYKQREKGRD